MQYVKLINDLKSYLTHKQVVRYLLQFKEWFKSDVCYNVIAAGFAGRVFLLHIADIEQVELPPRIIGIMAIMRIMVPNVQPDGEIPHE